MPFFSLRQTLFLVTVFLCPVYAWANPPVLSYLFPSGGQRGKEVQVRVGGLFLHSNSQFEIIGPGVSLIAPLKKIPFVWFDGPLLTLSESQQAEDYPKELSTIVRIDKDSSPFKRLARVWNSEGVNGGWKFEIGDLPEIIEKESEYDNFPTDVSLPITINGRIYPRNDFDDYRIFMKKGETIDASVSAEKFGSPLDARLEIIDSNGRTLVDNDDAVGVDPSLLFTAPVEGNYLVRIRESAGKGSPAHVYRLSISNKPLVKFAYPLGAKAGSKSRFEILGANLNDSNVEINIPDQPGLHQLFSGDNIFTDVGNFIEFLETPTTDGSNVIKNLPCAINGKILRVDEVDSWQIELEAGQKLYFESKGMGLGSPCRPKITVLDPNGKEASIIVSTSDLDPFSYFNASAKGMYTLKVTEEIPGRAGINFAYRILINTGASKKTSVVFVENSITVPRSGEAVLNLKIERSPGFDSQVDLSLDGLPDGITINPPAPFFAKGGSQVTLKLKANADAKVGSFLMGVSAIIPDQLVVQACLSGKPQDIRVDKVRVAVALPCPFKIIGEYNMKWGSRGGTLSRNYKLERSGFDGPVTIELADRQARHLQGVYGLPKIIPPGVDQFEYSVQLGPWMEIGRTSRVCVVGIATVKDHGVDHIVSYSSVNPNEQMIAVLESGKLDVSSASPDVGYEPGKACKIHLDVFRAPGLSGEVSMEVLFPDWTGIKNISKVEKADSNSSIIEFSVPTSLKVSFPIFVKSNLRQAGASHEAKLKIQMIPKASSLR